MADANTNFKDKLQLGELLTKRSGIKYLRQLEPLIDGLLDQENYLSESRNNMFYSSDSNIRAEMWNALFDFKSDDPFFRQKFFLALGPLSARNWDFSIFKLKGYGDAISNLDKAYNTSLLVEHFHGPWQEYLVGVSKEHCRRDYVRVGYREHLFADAVEVVEKAPFVVEGFENTFSDLIVVYNKIKNPNK